VPAAVQTDLFEGVAGHQPALRLLASQLESGRLSHAYLFVGEPGLGKTTVARRLATALLPEVPLRRHPDYWEDDRLKTISIDEIRLLPEKAPEAHEQSLQAFLSLKPAVGGRRVALIANAGRLQDQTQGILLKTLEEAHPNQVIILTTPSISPFVVLPTVVSRCQRVSFQAVSSAEVESLLVTKGTAVEPERARLLAELSRGRPGWALGAASDPSVLARHEELCRRLDEVFGAAQDLALRLAADLDAENFRWRGGDKSDEDPVVFALSSWQLHLRRRMLAEPESPRWARLLERSFDVVGYHEQNVSPRLALEVFLLECRRAT
jgi:DNA polymerase-3 subunit delta'